MELCMFVTYLPVDRGQIIKCRQDRRECHRKQIEQKGVYNNLLFGKEAIVLILENLPAYWLAI